MQLLTVSPSPHVRSGMTTQKIMGLVLLALLPAAVCGVIFFGIRALLIMLFCILISMATEAICQKLMKKPVTISDGSAALTGLLLALNLPATLPLWKAAVGCIFAIAVVKQLFGGLGCNFANPAITGRVFLLLSFAGDMTTWVKPFYYHGLSIGNQLSSSAGSLDLDAVTSATPLVTGTESLSNLFLGNVGGCIGETSALALLLGGLFLIFTRIISPSTPIAYLGSLGILTFFHALATGGSLTEVPYALLDGGVADSIPIRFFESIGYKRNLIILTQPKSFVKKKNPLLPAIRARYLRYPAFVEAVADRHERYNETLSYISMLEQAGADYVIRPPIPLEIGAMERDPAQLRRVYETGRAVAQIQIDKIKAFLDTAKAEPEA